MRLRKRFVCLLLAIIGSLTVPGFALAGGHLQVAIDADLPTLDPAKHTLGAEMVYGNLVFNGLTHIRPNLSVEPDLAESWNASADLKTWTFKLRSGVKFHNGHELEASDVVATFRRIMDKNTGSRGRSYLNMVESVEEVAPLTVRFNLSIPYAGFNENLGERQLKITPRDMLDQLSTNPIGTGPFMFKSYSHGDRVELVRNPNYFEAGLPKLDSITLKIIPEPASRVASIRSGAVDIVWSLPFESIDALRENPAIRIDSVPTATWDGLILNNETPPFDDLRVRQAVAATIDKKVLVELAIFGMGVPTHTPIPPNHPYFNQTIGFAKPDIEKAKQLLRTAGYPNGIEVTMQVPQEREARARLGVAISDMARAAGIRIKVQRVPFATYTADVAGKAQIYIDGYFARPTIDTAIYPFFHSQGVYNKWLWKYKNADVDALLERSRRTENEAERKEIFDEFQRIVVETVPSVIVYTVMHVNGVRKEVKGFSSTPMMWLELKNVDL